jgi:hypothetical protein
MRHRTPINSTNVRFGAALLAAGLWCAFVALLAGTHALATLAGDILLLAGFASAVALLAYAVDAELRSAIESLPAWVCFAIAVAAAALCALHDVTLLALSPFAAVYLAAAVRRRPQPKLSSAPAASPAASRVAP